MNATLDNFNVENMTDNYTSSTDFSDRFEGNLPFSVQIIQMILFSIVCVTGLVGNTLVIYVVIRFSKMQTVTNMYIVNLAIADEFFIIGIPFLIVTMIYNHWIFGYWVCKAYMITTSINQFTSSIFLCIMSADRYIAVCHPISSPRWRTPFISKVVSLLAWCCSILLIIPIIEYATEIQTDEDGKKSCNIEWGTVVNTTNVTVLEDANIYSATVFTLYTFILSFAIPLCCILFFYCQVIKKLKTVGPKNKSKEKKRSHRKVTNLVLTVVTVYICCWLPYWILQLFISESYHSTFNTTLHLIASMLSYSNSAVNPILYAFLSDNFKKSFMKACTCAANQDVNATLHLENSVFPKKSKPSSERGGRPARTTSICPGGDGDEEGDLGPLVSRADASTSAITMTSRTNVTSLSGSRDSVAKCRNGAALLSPPTCL